MAKSSFVEFTVYDSLGNHAALIDIDDLVLVKPAPDGNTTVEMSTGTILTIMQPYADVKSVLTK